MRSVLRFGRTLRVILIALFLAPAAVRAQDAAIRVAQQHQPPPAHHPESVVCPLDPFPKVNADLTPIQAMDRQAPGADPVQARPLESAAEYPEAAHWQPAVVSVGQQRLEPATDRKAIVPRAPKENRVATAALPPIAVQAAASPSPPTPPGVDDYWWKQLVATPEAVDGPMQSVTTSTLVIQALANSPQILAISQQPLIEEVAITEARAEFDLELFVRTRFDDTYDPVGNILTTGSAPFLQDHIWTMDAGVRRKLYAGGSLEIGQLLGFQNSNSDFFEPQDQGTATLSLNYTQPLLRGAGRFYNESQILIAQANSNIAWNAFSARLQDQLQQVVQSYWALFYFRSVLLQKQENVRRGEEVLALLEGRSQLDSLPSQISRARAAVQARRTEMANAFRDVRNAETEIRRLVGDPNWIADAQVELVPAELPVDLLVPQQLEDVVATALDQRPEIGEALKRARIAGIECDLSRNELLPELTMIFGTYVSGLRGESRVFTAWRDQFAATTPGYYAGLEFEFPYRNRAARSRYVQSRLQLTQIRYEVDQVAQKVVAEAEVALRRMNAAYDTLVSAAESIAAAQQDLQHHQQRWEHFALVEGDLAQGATPTTLLDLLLDAQQRLTMAELTYSKAELDFKVAEIGLRRATGTLLQYEQVSINKTCRGDLPQLLLDKAADLP